MSRSHLPENTDIAGLDWASLSQLREEPAGIGSFLAKVDDSCGDKILLDVHSGCGSRGL